MAKVQRITSHLWFAHEAEEAAKFYVSVFKNSRIGKISHYTQAGQETHKMKPGSVMVVEFSLDGQQFMALNGGPIFKFNESVSFLVNCDSQEEIDYYWDKLKEGGDPKSQVCGWLKDKYGLSWQVVPTRMSELMSGKDKEGNDRVMIEMMKMKKLDINKLEEAYHGEVHA